MGLPDVVVTWLQNDYGTLGRAAESVAHALVDGGLARTVAYLEPPVPGPGRPTLTGENDRGLHVYRATGENVPGNDVATAVVTSSGLTDAVLLNFGVAEWNWWFHHAFAPLCGSTVVVGHDLLHTWPGINPAAAARLARVRRLLLRSADHVAGLSEGAIADWPAGRYVGHGCDPIWTEPGVDATPEPADLAPIPHPRALYYGALSVRIDVDAIAALADSGIQVVLVGFAPSPRMAALIEAHPAVHFLGQKSPAESAAYLLHCDAGIVPHTDEPFTASMEPHKVYNYACAGLPVVALNCALPPHLARVIADCRRTDDFVAATVAAVGRGRLGRDELELARTQTWGAVAQRLLDVAGAGSAGTPVAAVA